MRNYRFVVYANNEVVGTADTFEFAKAIEETYKRIGMVTKVCIETF